MSKKNNSINVFNLTGDCAEYFDTAIENINSSKTEAEATVAGLLALSGGGFLRVEDVFVETLPVRNWLESHELEIKPSSKKTSMFMPVETNEHNEDICNEFAGLAGVNLSDLSGLRVWLPEAGSGLTYVTTYEYGGKIYIVDSVNGLVSIFSVNKRNVYEYNETIDVNNSFSVVNGDTATLNQVIGAAWIRKEDLPIVVPNMPPTTIVVGKDRKGPCAQGDKVLSDGVVEVTHGWKRPHLRRAHYVWGLNGPVIRPAVIVNGGRVIKQTTIRDSIKHVRKDSDVPAVWK